MQKNVRRKLLVKKELQFKLAALQSFSMLLVAGTCLITYKALLNYIDMYVARGPELDMLIRNLSKTLIGQLVMLIIIGVSVSILVSNRILGPVYRLEKDTEDILSGGEEGYSRRIKVRTGDELLSLVDTVNKLLDRLDNSRLKRKQIITAAENRISAARSKFKDSPEIQESLSSIEKVFKE
ncbi:hypothetical protein KJ633_05180 [bacterium]|nr:hypothetical protein [bacterium]MBU3955834.1 hypothetical protein [bacterium]